MCTRDTAPLLLPDAGGGSVGEEVGLGLSAFVMTRRRHDTTHGPTCTPGSRLYLSSPDPTRVRYTPLLSSPDVSCGTPRTREDKGFPPEVPLIECPRNTPRNLPYWMCPSRIIHYLVAREVSSRLGGSGFRRSRSRF